MGNAPYSKSVGLSVAAEDINYLVGDHLLDGLTGRLQILPGVEVGGCSAKYLQNGGGHSKTEVGVDVYLADGALGSLTQLVLRNSNSSRHIAAVLVYLVDELLGHAGRAVQNYREAGQILLNGLEDIEAKLRFRAGLELVRTVAGADGDGERVAPGALDKLLYLLRTGIAGVAVRDP